MKVALVCRLFGRCRQAFYQSKADIENQVERERIILSAVREIRDADPGIGGYKLWVMLVALFGGKFVPGRDSFFVLLRRHGLMQPPRKARRTTNSNHRYHKYKNLIKGLVPNAANQLWVSDITYIPLVGGGACYLHLVTDAYSHMIVGWCVADTLRVSATLEALRKAIRLANRDLTGLIHHSDRGIQYCCDQYVSVLKEHGITVSMTEDYKPTDNAVAERANGIIKTECVYRRSPFSSVEHARNVIGNFIGFYNYRRPHMSIGNKIPFVVHTMETGEQPRLWKKKNYGTKSMNNDENDVPSPSRTTSPGDSLCRHP